MKIRVAPVLALSVLAVACGGDSSAPLGNALSRSEALALAVSYFEVLEGPSGQSSPASMSLIPDTTVTASEGSLPCPQGGVLNMQMQDTLIFDEVGPTMAINIGGTHRPVNCVHAAGSTPVTIDAEPPFVWSSRMRMVAGMPSGPVVETLMGSFQWSTNDGRNGSCSVNYSRVLNAMTGAETRGGTICGHTFTIRS
jgi:hypothetical protein